ncbi:MAG: AarF/UbiB family protein, partial [Pseudomonadota bacterium]
IRVSGLIPDGMDIAPLLVEARRQLKEEADYEREGAYLERFGSLLNDAPEFLVPGLHPDLTTRNALAMSYVPGVAIEATASQPQETRDQIMRLLIDLLFRELFEFRLMQTDPNFANYRFDAESRRIVLLDFGAAREFPQTTADRYRTLMIAGIGGSRQDIRDAAMNLGLFDEATRPHHQTEIVKIIDMAFEAFRHDGDFDFGNNDLAARMNEAGRQIGADRDFVHLPPMDVLYLQRKFAGMYLLATRLRARVDLRGCLASYLDSDQAASVQAGRFQIATLSSCP